MFNSKVYFFSVSNILCFFLLVFIAFPIKAEKNSHFKIFITSNLQGWLDSKDFYPQSKRRGIAFLIDDIRQKKQTYPLALLIDGGDFFYGSPRSFYAFENPTTLNLFIKNFLSLDYDSITLGNLDLQNLNLLEPLLQQKKLNLVSANIIHSNVEPYKIFYRENKKIFLAALSYPEIPLPEKSWKLLHWKKSLKKIKQAIKKENPDFVIGIFHLSKFFSPSKDIPSLEQVVEYYQNWDLLIASQSNKTSPTKISLPLERLQGIPVVTPASKGAGWLELDISLKDKKITTIPHWAISKEFSTKDGFAQYLKASTGWKYIKKENYKKCLEYSLAKAVQEKKTNYSILPHLRFKFFSLSQGETIQRKDLFYSLPHFNKRVFISLSAYDFSRTSDDYFQKKYFLEADRTPNITRFFKKYKKNFLVATSSYELRENSYLRKHFLLELNHIEKKTNNIHSLWFDYLKTHSPNQNLCGMFEK